MSETDIYAPELQQAFHALARILQFARGPEQAITLDALTERLCVPSRRYTEQILQHRLRELPYCIVAGSPGLFRPTSAEQINAYIASLRKRHLPLREREETVVHKALAEGWPRDAEWFTPRPQQQELFR